jgi:iron complex transport system ATP-binding protein
MNLSARDITVVRGGSTLLDRASASCSPGKVTVILGPNGAGKSTLLSCLAGIERPTTGSVMLGDVPLADMRSQSRAKTIGLLPQGGELHWDITARQLVSLGQMPHQGNFGLSDEGKAQIEGALHATDTAQYADRNMLSLSGGERARVLFARVLAGTPKWLLADEPLANLDPGHQLDMLTLLRAQADAGVGVIVVLHDLNHAAAVADHIIMMNIGVIQHQGSAEAVLTPAILAKVFNIEANVSSNSGGQIFVNISGKAA